MVIWVFGRLRVNNLILSGPLKISIWSLRWTAFSSNTGYIWRTGNKKTQVQEKKQTEVLTPLHARRHLNVGGTFFLLAAWGWTKEVPECFSPSVCVPSHSVKLCTKTISKWQVMNCNDHVLLLTLPGWWLSALGSECRILHGYTKISLVMGCHQLW